MIMEDIESALDPRTESGQEVLRLTDLIFTAVQEASDTLSHAGYLFLLNTVLVRAEKTIDAITRDPQSALLNAEARYLAEVDIAKMLYSTEELIDMLRGRILPDGEKCKSCDKRENCPVRVSGAGGEITEVN